MKRITILLGIALSTIQFSYAQGSVDIDDMSVQMGMGTNVHVKLTDSDFRIQDEVGSPLIFGNFGTGNVGIGTDMPGTTFDVAGDMYVGTTASGGTIWFKRFDGNVAASLSSTASNSEIRLASGGGSSFVTLQGHPTSGHVKINPDGGNVGIGTTSAPTEILEVAGNTKVQGSLEVVSNATVQGSLTVNGNLAVTGATWKRGAFGVNTPTTIDMNNFSGSAWEVIGIRQRAAGAFEARSVKYIVTLKRFSSANPKPCNIQKIGGNHTGWGGAWPYDGAVTVDANACTLTANGSYIYWYYQQIHTFTE